MNLQFLSALTSPFISYFQATIGLSCSSWIPEEDFSRNSSSNHSKKALEAKAEKVEKYSYRPRKSSFSLRLCIQKQREMSSPKRVFDEHKEGWIEEELILAASPQSKNNLIQ